MVLRGRKTLASSSMLESDRVAAPAAIMEFDEPRAAVQPDEGVRQTSLSSIGLVLLCTVIGAAAQFLLRYGAPDAVEGGLIGVLTNAVEGGLIGVLTNWPLLGGYCCLALNTGLLVLALRNGQLSVLYPIIALTYVWVTILSPFFFGEIIDVYKVVGVGLIVLGVSFIGLGSRS